MKALWDMRHWEYGDWATRIVPKEYRLLVMHLLHGSPTTSHFGMERSLRIILQLGISQLIYLRAGCLLNYCYQKIDGASLNDGQPLALSTTEQELWKTNYYNLKYDFISIKIRKKVMLHYNLSNISTYVSIIYMEFH